VSNQTPEQIEAEIEAQREQLAATVDQLTAKLDVKSQARHKANQLKDRPAAMGAAASLVAMAVAAWWWRRRHR
jgi:hypothetical protein